MRLITAAEALPALGMREAIAAVRAAFEQMGQGAGAVLAPGGVSTEDGAHALAVAGALLPAQGVAGASVAAGSPAAARHSVLLSALPSGEPLALIEAAAIARLSMPATVAVAARRLARRDARVLALLGAGESARLHADALLLAHPLQTVLVAAAQGAPELAARIATEFGVNARAVDATAAVSQADIVVSCAPTREPLFDGSKLEPGAFVAAVGADGPEARELDDAVLTRADLIAVEWLPAAQGRTGEFARAARGVLESTRIVELGRLLIGAVPYVRRAHDVTVFKGLGVGLAELALAHLVWQRLR
jgi:ornithine cyclodeaminase